jgi:hypothetical protein
MPTCRRPLCSLELPQIASLSWRMVTDAGGQIGHAIRLENRASKGQSGRVIPMNEELKTAFVEYSKTVYLPDSTLVIESERSKGMSPQGTSASTAVRVTAADALSSPISRGRYRLWAGLSGMSRCWPGTQTFGPHSVTSKLTRKRRSGSWT